MEKQAVIEEGRTPESKRPDAVVRPLGSDLVKEASDRAESCARGKRVCDGVPKPTAE